MINVRSCELFTAFLYNSQLKWLTNNLYVWRGSSNFDSILRYFNRIKTKPYKIFFKKVKNSSNQNSLIELIFFSSVHFKRITMVSVRVFFCLISVLSLSCATMNMAQLWRISILMKCSLRIFGLLLNSNYIFIGIKVVKNEWVKQPIPGGTTTK